MRTTGSALLHRPDTTLPFWTTRLLEPNADWRALDIATAAGYTAFALAPHVREVVATDLTPEMLEVGRAGATGS